MLRQLPVPSIEYLATHAAARDIAAGAVLFRQGDPGDSFFVVAAGEADVIGDGLPLRTVRPGDCFGEISLLRDVARTATVRARDGLVVFEIGRDAFLDVVVGHSTTMATARAVVARHLAEFDPANLGT
jgi:CRP-like cAMP-binding protein